MYVCMHIDLEKMDTSIYVYFNKWRSDRVLVRFVCMYVNLEQMDTIRYVCMYVCKYVCMYVC